MMGGVEREKGGVITKTTENGMYLSNDIPTKHDGKRTTPAANIETLSMEAMI
jgi:hypothetical protein